MSPNGAPARQAVPLPHLGMPVACRYCREMGLASGSIRSQPEIRSARPPLIRLPPALAASTH